MKWIFFFPQQGNPIVALECRTTPWSSVSVPTVLLLPVICSAAHPQPGTVIRVQTAIQAPRQTDEGDLLQGDPEGSRETINHLPVEENTKSSATGSITLEKYLDKTNT